MLVATPAVVAQPLTGWPLIRELGVSVGTPWVCAALVLYGVAGASWLPVVVLQRRIRDLAAAAAQGDEPLPAAYDRHFQR